MGLERCHLGVLGGTLLPLLNSLVLMILPNISSAQIVTDGSLGPRVSVAPRMLANGARLYEIGDAIGQIKGNNLFHSFATLDLQTPQFKPADIAAFGGPPSIVNIIARVTGGPSSIDGILASTINGANLYLLNSAGIVFGPHASTIDPSGAFRLTGSLHVGTPDYLMMADGAKFNSKPDAVQDKLLTAAPPSAFGFLSSHPAPIVIQGSSLFVQGGNTLSIVGGDVQIDGGGGGGGPAAFNGVVQIASVASPGIVIVNPPEALNVSSFAHLGKVTLSNNALVDVSDETGTGAGTVRIRAGQLLIDASTVQAVTQGDLDGARTGIDITVSGDAVLRNGSSILSSTQGMLSPTQQGSGRAGDVSVSASTLQLDNSAISATSVGVDGAAGNVRVAVGKLTVVSGGDIDASSFGPGPAGSVTITASDSVSVSGTNGVNPSRIASFSQSPVSNAGPITISTPSLLLSDGGSMFSDTQGAGRGGDVVVNVGGLTMTGAAQIIASSEQFFGRPSGSAGNIAVSAKDLISISGGSGLFSTTSGSGRGGNISLDAQRVRLSDRATLSATSSGSGDAGDITITAGGTFESFNSRIATEATQAAGGDITLAVQTLLHLVESQISASVQGGTGNGGNITVDPEAAALKESQIIANAFGGNGGNIRVFPDVFLADPSSVVSASSTLGLSGTVDIHGQVKNLSEALTLSGEFAPATKLLRASCAARHQWGSYSSFLVAPRAGVPPEPDTLLPIPLYGQTLPPETAAGTEPLLEDIPRLSGPKVLHDPVPEQRQPGLSFVWVSRCEASNR